MLKDYRQTPRRFVADALKALELSTHQVPPPLREVTRRDQRVPTEFVVQEIVAPVAALASMLVLCSAIRVSAKTPEVHATTLVPKFAFESR